ncbi:unnamed protein product [Durusdinium trenchii]|uniref:Uncharacterized protein n=2 Tax=Durusdinium trenchii TaxID=1381693 RepID=A0ABP0NYI9_9DINO
MSSFSPNKPFHSFSQPPPCRCTALLAAHLVRSAELASRQAQASGWHDYLGLYERLILHLPLTADVLEFGVRMGSSLAMWSEYFPLGHVVGIDKNLGTFFQRGRPAMALASQEGACNVYVLEANASDASGRRKLQRLGWEHFDLIVDDANHWHKVRAPFWMRAQGGRVREHELSRTGVQTLPMLQISRV